MPPTRSTSGARSSSIGVPEIPVAIEDIAKWQAVADSAERYRDGRSAS